MSWLFSFLIFLPSPAVAATEVMATVSSNKVGLGQPFVLNITVSSEDSVNASEPEWQENAALRMNRRSQMVESQASFVNNKYQVTRKQTFQFEVIAVKAGNVRIASFPVEVNGKTYNTKPIEIMVTAHAQAVPQDTDEEDDPIEDLFTQLLRRRGMPSLKGEEVNPQDAFFIKAEVDKAKVFVGEQITASWYLYTREQIRDIDTLKYPDLKGFWKEDIEVATRLNFTNEVVNGVLYHKALLASYALFPIRAGPASVDSYKAKCTIISTSPLSFGDAHPVTKSSSEIKVEVVPLPAEGKPENFSGAVGQFSVMAKLDKTEIPANQPVSLKIRFEGRGNAKMIELPKFNFGPTVDLYDSKNESKFYPNGTSFKEFELLLIPRQEGAVEIASQTVSMFDPASKKYYQRVTPSLQLKVLPSVGGAPLAASPLNTPPAVQAPVSRQPPQMPGLITEWQSSAISLGGGLKALIWALAYLAVLIALGVRFKQALGWGEQRRDLNKVIRSRLQPIYQKVDRGDWRGVGVDMTNTVYYLLGQVSGEGGASAVVDELLLKAPPSVRRELSEPLKKLLASFEALGFAPEAVIGDLKQPEKLKSLVAQMEKILVRAIQLGLGSISTKD
jgi:hypothetical protein